MSGERIVLSPGPVHVPPARWEAIPPVHHRSDEFRSIVRETERMIRELLGTDAPAYTITASGTGGMEFAVANITSPASRVLVVSGGKFGDRWDELCRSYRCETEIIRFPEGQAIDIDRVAARVASFRPELLALTHVESSTGLLLSLDEFIAALPAPRPVVMCDAIASLGVEVLEMDAWGIDVVVAASQKGFAAPPGASFVCLGKRALELAKKSGGTPYYFSLDRYERGRGRGNTPFTPAVQIVQIVHRTLGRMKEIGWEEVRNRHVETSRAFIDAARYLSLESFPEYPSSAVQSFYIPDSYKGKSLVGDLAEREGIVVAGGQGPLAGKVIRTGFLGLHGGKTLERVITSIAAVLGEGGCPVDLDSAKRAIEVISDQGDLFL